MCTQGLAMSTKKFWYRVSDGIVSYEEAENFGDDYWFFDCEGQVESLDDDDPRVQHVDDLFESEEDANRSALESLDSETTELERKKALLDIRIKNTILKLKGLNLKD
jgi:hypothetical protein